MDDAKPLFDGYENVTSILKDRRFGSPEPPTGFLRALRLIGLGSLARAVETGFFTLQDGAAHTRLRRVVEPFFNRRAVLAREGEIEAIMNGVLDRVDHGGEFDLVSQVAAQLPARVISEIFGFPEEDREYLNGLALDLAPLGDQELHRASLVPGLIAFWKFRRVVVREVRKRKDDRRDDLLSALAEAHYGPEGLTFDEVVGIATMTFTAGQTTITHLVGSCASRLLLHPEAASRAANDPEYVERMVEEVLRMHSPLQRVTRAAREDVEVDGRTIPGGTAVRLMLAQANRDPERFEHPEDFDLDRKPNYHIAFAAGPHFCFGLHLARLEGKVAVRSLLTRFPGLTATSDDRVWRDGTKFHGLEDLRVRP